MNYKPLLIALFLALTLPLILGKAPVLLTNHDENAVLGIDLERAKEFKVGEYDVSLIAVDSYLRLNIFNPDAGSYTTYHITNPPKTTKLSVFTGNSTQTIELKNIPKPSQTSPLLSTKYNRYDANIEDVLYDTEFLGRKGYFRNNKIPVIITLNLDQAPSVGVRSDSFSYAKEKLMKALGKGIRAMSDETLDLRLIDAVATDIDQEDIERLRSMDIVRRVSLDKKVYAFLTESAGIINATKAWKTLDEEGHNITGANTTIAIIDTGVDYTHPDLGGCFGPACKVIGGYDFYNRDADPMDDHGHGTHCAGIAAGNGILKGVAPDAKIYAYKVLSSDGSGSSSDIIAAIQRAMDPNDDGSTSDHADVISMSLGGSGNPDDEMSRAVDEAVRAGIVVAVSAGNSGPYAETIGSPGCARLATTVGASCKGSQIGSESYCENAVASFSSRGPTSIGSIKPDVLAPGVNICSAQHDDAWEESQCIDDEHTAISGTSMSCPHVAGAAALIRQARSWSPKEIKSALMLTARDMGFSPDTQGTGVIDVMRAINSPIATYPQSISFGEVMQENLSANITIENLLDTVISINLSVSDATGDSGENYSIGTLNQTALDIPPGRNATVRLMINLSSQAQGRIYGHILINLSRQYRVPFTLIRLSQLTLTARGRKPLYPDFLVHNSDLSFKDGVFQGGNFEGDTYTFKIPAGNYTAYAIGDFEDLSTEYILMRDVYVPPNSKVNLSLNTTDARAFTIKAKSLSGHDLALYEYEKAFISYNNESKLSYSFNDPGVGDRTVYISNKPENMVDTDVFFRYHGVPSDSPFPGSSVSVSVG